MKQHTLLIAFLVGTLVVSTAFADVYMHNMRGSNDRNCERNVNRNNGNRLFDSQNNAKGGYACPRAVGGQAAAAQTPNMYYYVGWGGVGWGGWAAEAEPPLGEPFFCC